MVTAQQPFSSFKRFLDFLSGDPVADPTYKR